MKFNFKEVLTTVIFFMVTPVLNAQGLEKIIVEKYYISDQNDVCRSGGYLPPGSVTYRIYVDMKPGYKFQAAFGIPRHELKLETTTDFFNNEDYGSFIPTVIPFKSIGDNTTMLDSWLSAGAACENNWGVLKTEDDENATIINKDHILQNTDSKAGIPLNKRDGLFSGVTPRIVFFGIDSMAKAMFSNINLKISPQKFITDNGSWATLEGTNGPTPENRVLIAQMTTNGIFSFELNIQIGRPGEGYERYVARNPGDDEIINETLIYNSSKGN
jgi:hypothetical protein